MLAVCKTKNLEVSKGYLDGDLVIQDQHQHSYDAFGIFSFMEHWPNPSEALSILWDLLAEEAYGIIEVPNFEMIQKKGFIQNLLLTIFFISIRIHFHNSYKAMDLKSPQSKLFGMIIFYLLKLRKEPAFQLATLNKV